MFKKLFLSLFFVQAIFAVSQQQGMKIDEYPATTTVGDNDLFLLDYWNGSRYSTNKNISSTNFITQILSLISRNSSPLGTFNVVDFGASTNGVTDATLAVQNTFNAAAAFGGGEIIIPAPFTFNILGLTNATLNNIYVTGGGTLKASATRTNWLQLTGDNVIWDNVQLDGNLLVQRLVYVGANSDYWIVRNSTFKNARVTDANDPLNTPSTGSATAGAFRFNNGSKHLIFANNSFLNFSYDGTHPYLGGVGRTSRALHFAPFPTATTDADAIRDVIIIGNKFINNSADKEKVDNDAIVFQNVDEDLIPDVQFIGDGNYIENWGWRGFKLQVSGVKVVNNTIVSGTVNGLAGPCMRSGIEWFGHHALIKGNFISGGTIEHPINVFGFDYYPHDFVIEGNIINLTAAGNDLTYDIWVKNAFRGTISGNTITNGIRGIYLRGWCQNISITGNTLSGVQETGIMVGPESDPDGAWPFNGKSANQLTILGNTLNGCVTNGIKVFSGATNVTILGTQGVLTSGNPVVNQASGTGSYSGHNQGVADTVGSLTTLSEFTVNSTNSSGTTWSAIINVATNGDISFYDNSHSRLGLINSNRDMTWGSTASTNRVTMGGITRLTRLETTATALTASGGAITIDFTGTQKQTHTQSGSLTVNASGMNLWQELVFELIGDGSAITWPAWTVLGRPLPSSVSSGKILYVTLSSMGTTDAGVRARCWLQDRNTQAFVNGTLVDNPNFKDSATVTWGVSGTNITLTASGSGGSAPTGTMVSDGSTFVSGTVPISKDTTGTNFTGTSTITVTGTNTSFKGGIFADSATFTNGLTIGGGSTNLNISGNIFANGATFTNTVTLYGGTAISDTSTNTLTNKTFDSQGTGNVLKLLDYKDFIYPHKIDGTGTTIITNDYTSGFSGLVKYNGTGGTNANYAFFRIGTVPIDLDTGTVMVLKNLGFVVSGTDTASASFSIALFSPASSSVFTPSDFTACSTFINFTTGTLTSPVANDQFYFSDVTLTGWAAALTPGRPLIIGIARDGTDSNNDSITLTGGTILYGRTQ